MGWDRGVIFIFISMVVGHPHPDPSYSDWLVHSSTTKTTFTKENENLFRLSNELIHRDFITVPNFATIDYYSHEEDTSILRALSPEAQIKIIGARNVTLNVGGVVADVPRGYLNRTDLRLRPYPGAIFKYFNHSISKITSDIKYTPRRGAPKSTSWPPEGLHLTVQFIFEDNDVSNSFKNLEVYVHYEMYVKMG